MFPISPLSTGKGRAAASLKTSSDSQTTSIAPVGISLFSFPAGRVFTTPEIRTHHSARSSPAIFSSVISYQESVISIRSSVVRRLLLFILPSPPSTIITPNQKHLGCISYFVLFVKKTFFLQQNYTKKRSSLWVKLTHLPVLIGITF